MRRAAEKLAGSGFDAGVLPSGMPRPSEVVTGTIPLASAILVQDSLTVTGPGEGALTLSGGYASGIFSLEPGHAEIGRAHV